MPIFIFRGSKRGCYSLWMLIWQLFFRDLLKFKFFKLSCFWKRRSNKLRIISAIITHVKLIILQQFFTLWSKYSFLWLSYFNLRWVKSYLKLLETIKCSFKSKLWWIYLSYNFGFWRLNCQFWTSNNLNLSFH